MSFLQEENTVTNNYLSKIPYRDSIKARYSDLMNYEKVGAPRRVGDYYFMNKNDGLQDQSVIYYKKGDDGEE